MSSYMFNPNSLGRDMIVVPDDKRDLRSAIENDIFYTRTDPHNEYGEPIATNRTASLDCAVRKPQRIAYKFSPSRQRSGPGGANTFDPADLEWQTGSMGVPKPNVRFDRVYDPYPADLEPATYGFKCNQSCGH